MARIQSKDGHLHQNCNHVDEEDGTDLRYMEEMK